MSPQNVYIVYQPKDSQTSCKVLLASGERRRCSNKTNTRNPLKFAGYVPHTRQPISAVSGLKFATSWGVSWRYCCLTNFFPIVNICLSCEDIAGQICAMVPRWRILSPAFPASRVQHVSDMHSNFALGPHHCVEVW